MECPIPGPVLRISVGRLRMAEPRLTDYRELLEAASFAARAHDGQMRKDGATPYVSHVYRVCLIVRHVFGIADARVLTAALLHDTIEDTRVDFDDVEAHFGVEVAEWVALLSKDKRMAEAPREETYLAQLARAPWQVQACKLADIYDNLMDSPTLPAERRPRAMARARQYLDGLRDHIAPEVKKPFALVAELLAAVDRG